VALMVRGLGRGVLRETAFAWSRVAVPDETR
jgi:hypothetical protein